MAPLEQAELLEASMLPRGIKLVVACSGGGDSMALLHLVAGMAGEQGWQVTVAHLDHGLRTESPDDAALVEAAARDLRLPAVMESVRVAEEAEPGEGLEAAARRLRYAFLRRVREHAGPEARVVTGHTLDDQVETLAMRLVRGTGVRGLRGILPVREDGIIRPLLHVRREELRDYLASRGLAWREDPSNLDTTILRNRWRSLIGGLDASRRADLYELAGMLTGQARRLHLRLGALAEWWLQRSQADARGSAVIGGPAGLMTGEILLERPGEGIHLGWAGQALLDAALNAVGIDPRDVSRRSRESLLLHLQGPETGDAGGRGLVQLGERIWSEYLPAGVLFAGDSDPHWERTDSWQETVEAEGSTAGRAGRVKLPRGGTIRVERATTDEIEALRSGDPPEAVRSGRRVVVDVLALSTRFVVRYPRGGDVMRPFGMKGHKRLSDLFGEAAVPRLRRGRLPVVLAGDEVVWVAGLRAAEAVRVGNGTEKAMALVFET